MTDTITHKGRTYTLAETVYSSTIDGDPVAEANLRWVEENIRRGRVPYFFVGDPPTTWYPSRYAAADDRSFVDIQMALSIDKPATAGYYIYTITNAED